MTKMVRDFLQAFDSLPPADQHQIATEMLRRWSPDTALPEAALDELAVELFRAYDAEEADRASS